MYQTLGTACLHLNGQNIGSLRGLVFRSRNDIYQALDHFGVKSKDRHVLLQKTIIQLRKAREKGYEYIPFPPSSSILTPLDNTSSLFPGVFVATASPQRFREALSRSTVSVIGTRDPSLRGTELTKRLVQSLSHDNTLVTGFSLGISETAIHTALEAGMPVLAISATGAGDIYPKAMNNLCILLQKIPGCAMITPFFPKEGPLAINFLNRNRLIALSDKTIIVESKEKGGSIVTAHMARSYNRSVFAVPGRPDDIRSKGCNQLIRERTAELLLEI